MSDHVIVWDLETVPDIAGYAAANGLTGKSDEEIREAIGNKFQKHIYHSIVCIGALVAHKERELGSRRNRCAACRGATREGVGRVVRGPHR